MAASFSTIPSNPDWYFDSGATHYVTNDLANLTIHDTYNGQDTISVGNDSYVQIHHIGSGLLLASPNLFQLHNLIHAPSISSNLVYVHQFAKDNNCIISIDASHFVVQDKYSMRILL